MCKSVQRSDIEENDWSLTPGRYVGVTAIAEDEGFDFEERMEAIRDELDSLNIQASELAKQIDGSLLGIVQ